MTNDEYIKETNLQSIINESDRENKIDCGSYKIRLDKLVADILGFDDGTFNIKVYITEEINAFAWPDGSIRVYSGLMDILEDDELVGIIGHEMGHVVNEDSLKAFRVSQRVNALKKVYEGSPFFKPSRLNAFLREYVADPFVERYVNATYDKYQENRADDFGMKVAFVCGFDPQCMARALDKFVMLEAGSRQPLIKRMMASHPESNFRAERIRKKAFKLGAE